MIAVTQCPLCGSDAQEPLVSFSDDPYLRKLPNRTDHRVRYVVCVDCGFVCQGEMMDAAEMEVLYTTTYRQPEPPVQYLRDVRGVALDVYSWIVSRTGGRGAGRSVLDIGCAAGLSLRPFALAGWEAVGLDPGAEWVEYGRREFGLDLRAEFFRKESLPGRTFHMILYSHVIEHVLDPAPVLEAIRGKLTDDGYLFIGTPNVLAPNRKLHPGLFGGDHVRLFSPRTLAAYLRRLGFRPICVETHQPRGIRALAVKAEPAPPDVRERDEWRTLQALYRGLFTSRAQGLFERNLAALAAGQEPVLEALCGRQGPSPYRVSAVAGDVDNMERVGPDGSAAWLYGRQGSRARTRWALDRVPARLEGAVLLAGLGLGHFAEALHARLGDAGHLTIWEPDPRLCAATVRARDLDALLRSPRVTLHVGPGLDVLRRPSGRAGLRMLMHDPVVSSLRHPLAEELEAWARVVWGRGIAEADLVQAGVSGDRARCAESAR